MQPEWLFYLGTYDMELTRYHEIRKPATELVKSFADTVFNGLERALTRGVPKHTVDAGKSLREAETVSEAIRGIQTTYTQPEAGFGYLDRPDAFVVDL